MELSSLNFVSNTSELEKASQVINQLVQDMSKVSMSSAQMAKVSAQTEAILARAAIDSAKARKENAKAADQELKSAIAADKADNARESTTTKVTNSIKKKTKAVEDSAEATERSAAILKRQTDILEFNTKGWTTGQASILATARAAKATTVEMEQLEKVLDNQRNLKGKNPFDDNISGMKSLEKQYLELSDSVNEYNKGSSLTAKQNRELYRDKERLTMLLNQEGKSVLDVNKAIDDHVNKYTALAKQYNTLNSAEGAVVKSRKDMVSATNYVTQAEDKMSAALNISNAALGKDGTDSLVKYENALRKSGIAQDLMVTKLNTYKTQLAQVQAQEEKRKVQHLTRAAQPQITDLAVSLYSGQAPLTVLLQQGGQLTDLFKLSGIEAANFGKVMKEAMYGMGPAIVTVTKGLAGMVGGLFIDAGKATAKFSADLLGITSAVDMMKRAVASGGEANFKYIGTINKIGTAFAFLAGGAIFAVVTSLIALAVALKQVIAQENELNKAMTLNGAAMAMTADTASAYVDQLGAMTGSTTKAVTALASMANAGNISSKNILMIGEAAINLEKAAGVPIDETIKKFSKLAEEPGKVLIEVAKSQGGISAELIKTVLAYERNGESAKATELATKAYADSTKQAADTVVANYGDLTAFAKRVAGIFGKMWDAVLGVDRKTNLTDKLNDVKERISENSKRTAGFFTSQRDIDNQDSHLNAMLMGLEHQLKLELEVGKAKELSGKAAGLEEWRNRSILSSATDRQKADRELLKLQNMKNDAVKDGLWSASLELEYAKSRQKIEDDLNKKGSKSPKSPSTKKPPEESFFDKSIKQFRNDAIAAEVATDGLVKSQVALLKIVNDPLFDKWSMKEKLAVLQIAAKAIGLEQEAEAQKALNKAKEDFDKQRTKSLADQDSETAKINEKAQLIEDEISQYGMGKRAIVEMSIARDLERKSILLQMGATKEEVAYIDELILAKQRLANAEDIKKNKDNFSNQSKTDLKELNDFLDPAKADKFGEALTKAFDGAGNALSKLVNVFDDYARRDAELAQMKAKLYAETDPIKYKLKEIALDKKSRDAQLTTYASVAGAAKGFFKEGSRGYKTMEKVETTFRAVQLAGAIKEAAIKIGLISAETTAGVAGQATLTGATIAGAAARVTALIPNIIAAFSAVLGPFGPPAAYAMLAAIGISASGAGKAKELPKTNLGTGTVFGDKDAKSESVSKSVQLLESISKFNEIENAYAAKMLFSLKSIESQIQGFTSVLLRNGGVKAAGDSVKQGYAPNGLTKAGSLASTAVSVAALLAGTLGPIGFIVGAIVGKLLGPLINKLFGTKTTVTGQGLYTKDATVSQIANGDLEAGYYADINKKKKFFGATYSNKNSTQYTKDDEASKQVSMIINSFVDSIKTAAPILGFSLDQIDDNLKDFVVKIGKIDLKDLKGAEIQEKLNAVFGAAGDGIAKAAIPGLEHLAEVGEGYLETLVRVATNLSSVNQMFDVLGVNLYESSIAGAEASLAMSELFGGLDKLTETLSSYYKNFYTEEERMAKLTQDLTVKFKGMNKELPKTKEEFRALATELLNSGPEAQALAAEVLLLADAFNTTAEYADKLAKEQEEKVKKAKEDAAKTLNDAYSSLEKAVKAEQKILQDREKAAQDSVTRLKSIFDVLKQNIQELYNQVESTSAMNSIKGKSVISSALTSGELPDSKELADAIGAVRKEIDSTSYETLFEQEKAKLQLAGDLVILQKSAEVQLSNAELQLKSLKDQNLNLEALLESVRKSVDTELGIDTSVKSVEQAVKDLTELLSPSSKPSTPGKPGSSGPSFGAGGRSSTSSEPSKYQDLQFIGSSTVGRNNVTDTDRITKLDMLYPIYHSFDGTGDVVGLLNAVKAAGGSVADLSTLSGYWQKDWYSTIKSVDMEPFANGGVFANQVVSSPTSFDMGLMGESGPEAIMPLTSINGKLGVASNNSSNTALEDKVQNLSIELRAIAINTGKVSRLLERVTRDGESMIVTTEV